MLTPYRARHTGMRECNKSANVLGVKVLLVQSKPRYEPYGVEQIWKREQADDILVP